MREINPIEELDKKQSKAKKRGRDMGVYKRGSQPLRYAAFTTLDTSLTKTMAGDGGFEPPTSGFGGH